MFGNTMDGSVKFCRISEGSKVLYLCKFISFADHGTMVVENTISKERIIISEDWWDAGSIGKMKEVLKNTEVSNLQIPFSVSTSSPNKKPESANSLITKEESIEDFVPEQLDSHTKFYDDFELTSKLK